MVNGSVNLSKALRVLQEAQPNGIAALFQEAHHLCLGSVADVHAVDGHNAKPRMDVVGGSLCVVDSVDENTVVALPH
jgi:hypothetical protein